MLIELTLVLGQSDPDPQNIHSRHPHYYAYYCSKCDEMRRATHNMKHAAMFP